MSSIFKDKKSQGKEFKYFAHVTQLIRSRNNKPKSLNPKLRTVFRTQICQFASGPGQKELERVLGPEGIV